MSKIFKYAILAALIYFAIKEVPPLVEKVSDMGSNLGRKGASISQSDCVVNAEHASESFARGLRDFSQPPVDLDDWDRFVERVRGDVYRAQAECDCPRKSCQRANEAIDELNTLIADFNNSLRGDGIPLNPARQQETIDRMLKRAREADRQGD